MASEGWNDVFLDRDPNRSIGAGERWERALHTAAIRDGVVFNVDSLTEMDRSYADRYVAFAGDHAEVFISINHEINPLIASEVIRAIMPGAFVMRSPHQMRPGYVEEVVLSKAGRELGEP